MLQITLVSQIILLTHFLQLGHLATFTELLLWSTVLSKVSIYLLFKRRGHNIDTRASILRKQQQQNLLIMHQALCELYLL